MGILFFSKQPPDSMAGGVERIVAMVSAGLREKGLTVYTASFYTEPFKPAENHFFISSASRNKTVAEIIAIIKQNNITTIVLHENGYAIVTIFRRVKLRLPGIHLITQIHHIIPDNAYVVSWCLYSLKNSTFVKKILKGILILPFIILAIARSYIALYLLVTMSDQLVLLSRKFIKDLQKRLFFIRIDEKKIAVIPNPLSFPLEKTEVSEKENIILFIGRLSDFDKNILEIVKIWAKAESERIDGNWKLLIIGDGPDKQKMIKLARKYRLKNIEWLGKQNPVEWYKKARILMLTSREGWGLVLTEAMQFKAIPIAYQSYSSVTDIIRDGYNGFLVRKNDRKSYSDKLCWLMRNEDTLDALRENGYRSVERLAPDKIVGQWLELLSV